MESNDPNATNMILEYLKRIETKQDGMQHSILDMQDRIAILEARRSSRKSTPVTTPRILENLIDDQDVKVKADTAIRAVYTP